MTGDSLLHVLAGAVRWVGGWFAVGLLIAGLFSASKVLQRRWRDRLAAEHRRGFNAGLAFASRVLSPAVTSDGPPTYRFQAVDDRLAIDVLVEDSKRWRK